MGSLLYTKFLRTDFRQLACLLEGPQHISEIPAGLEVLGTTDPQLQIIAADPIIKHKVVDGQLVAAELGVLQHTQLHFLRVEGMGPAGLLVENLKALHI